MNNNGVAIRVTNVSKRFKLYHNPITGPVKEILFYHKRNSFYDEFMAVQDVSMEVKRGEVVGIIGPNGAGKTTLLKMIAGLLPIDKGKIEVNGNITALLALGVGVHPEFTGKENILYGGMLLGMSKNEVLSKMDSIIEFAELGEYIRYPFRTYSSGMKARLLFAISMSIDPDILIVDEALATGDSYFLTKSRKRILELCRSGTTILFVSHNLLQVQELCDRTYLMAEGRFVKDGNTDEVIVHYNNWEYEKEKSAVKITTDSDLLMIGGTGEVQLTDILLNNACGKTTQAFLTGEKMEVEITYESTLPTNTQCSVFASFVLASDSSWVSEFSSMNKLAIDDCDQIVAIQKTGKIKIVFEPLLLLNNHYGLWIIISRYPFKSKTDDTLCMYKNVSQFYVSLKDNSINKAYAYFWHPGIIEG